MSKKHRTGNPARRRATRIRLHDDERVVVWPGPLHPAMTGASLEDLLAALEGFDPDRGWAAVANSAIPLFQRVRPYPPGIPDPVRTILPPGISVTFALDMGPAFTHITDEMLHRWRVPFDEVRETALANLARRAETAASIPLVSGDVNGIGVRAMQSGTGSASTFVLVPHLLPPIFGPEPQFFVAPMRDLLISLPADVDRDFAVWLLAELAALDANHLAPVGFAYRGGAIVVEPLGDAAAIA